MFPVLFSSFDTFLTPVAAKRTRTANQNVLQINLLQNSCIVEPLLLFNQQNFLILKQLVLLRCLKAFRVKEVKFPRLHQICLFTQLSLKEDVLYFLNFRKAVCPFILYKVELTLILKKKEASVI